MQFFLIADDHAMIRNRVRQILTDEFSPAVIEEAADTDSLVKKGISQYWDVIISDLSMPGGGGKTAFLKILKANPGQRILVVSIFPETNYAIEMLRLGAYGYINKEKLPEYLAEAVKTIMRGVHYFSPLMKARMISEKSAPHWLLPHELLDYRELEIMLLLAKGTPLQEIEARLLLENSIIESAGQKALEKMGMKSIAEFISYANKNSLV